MDLTSVPIEKIVARGEYATVNGEYKTLMSLIQARTQEACDYLRHGLQAADAEHALYCYSCAEMIAASLKASVEEAAALKTQKDALYQLAWGK